MSNLSKLDQASNSIDLPNIQSALTQFYPEIERSITPLLIRLGYGPQKSKQAAADYMNVRRVYEQAELLMRYAGSLKGKKLLEVGSGFGLFVAFSNKYLNVQACGIEPSESEFEATYQFALKLLRFWDVDAEAIKRGCGESIPFKDETFDIVYSTNVLEHVQDPRRVMQESIRVLKPGGILQFIVPNYGSFWEGHYAVPWFPYMPKFVARVYMRLIGKDPWFIDTLCLINYFSLKKMIKKFVDHHEVEVLGWGNELFVERMTKVNFSEWGGLSVLKGWVRAANKLGISRPLAQLLVAAKAQTPLVLTLRKRIV